MLPNAVLKLHGNGTSRYIDRVNFKINFILILSLGKYIIYVL